MTTLPPRRCCATRMMRLRCNIFAMQRQKLKKENGFQQRRFSYTWPLAKGSIFPANWSGKRGSNSRPQPWQGCALPLSYSREKQCWHYKDAATFVKKRQPQSTFITNFSYALMPGELQPSDSIPLTKALGWQPDRSAMFPPIAG